MLKNISVKTGILLVLAIFSIALSSLSLYAWASARSSDQGMRDLYNMAVLQVNPFLQYDKDKVEYLKMQNNSITEIQQQLEKYFDALYFCDVKLLNDVFHPDAVYINATDQPVLGLSMSEYFPIVASRISPASKQQLRQDKIISINMIHDQLAMVHVECVIQPKYFYDALTFVQKEGEWKIISKVFHYQLLED